MTCALRLIIAFPSRVVFVRVISSLLGPSGGRKNFRLIKDDNTARGPDKTNHQTYIQTDSVESYYTYAGIRSRIPISLGLKAVILREMQMSLIESSVNCVVGLRHARLSEALLK